MPRRSSARTRSWPVLAVVSVVGVGASMLPLATARAQPAAGARAPQFQVDPSWPKPLPNGWLMGQAAGVTVDAQDHVWVIQRAHADRGRAGRDPQPAALALLRAGAAR